MKRFAIVVALLALISAVASAENGAAVYKSKCAMCHGADAQGKVGPALKDVNMSDAQIVDLLIKGEAAKKAPHSKPVNGLSADQAKTAAEFVKGLK